MPAARLITTLAIFMRLQVASSSFSVTILRHAETEWNVRGMLQGSRTAVSQSEVSSRHGSVASD